MDRPKRSFDTVLRQFIGLVKSTNSRRDAKSTVIAMAFLGIWLAVVLFTVARHEFWRDEVRALSLARAAASPLDLYDLTKYDGHPILWFLILYVGKSIVDIPLILPVISVIIGFAGAAVFMFFSPFQLWVRLLFIFSAFSIYEYSVMARNYGISMLLFFVSAILYEKRARHPWLLALVLALLANTNVHSAMLVCLFTFVWMWESVVEWRAMPAQQRDFATWLPFLIVFAGVLACAIFTLPRDNTILTSVRHEFGISELANALFKAARHPEETFAKIVPTLPPSWVVTALLYLAVLGLLRRPSLFLAGFGSLIIFGVLVRMVFPSGYRHQGLFLIFLLVLYWLYLASPRTGAGSRAEDGLFRAGFYGAMLLLLLVSVVEAKDLLLADIERERSSSRAFGEFLNSSDVYHDAIIVAEPDFLLESLPYYANNPIYFPREHRFGTTVSWTTDADPDLSLGGLLSIARDLESQQDQPVLIVIGHRQIDQDTDNEVSFPYGKTFSWSSGEVEDLNGSTTLVADFASAYTDENYHVYALHEPLP